MSLREELGSYQIFEIDEERAIEHLTAVGQAMIPIFQDFACRMQAFGAAVNELNWSVYRSLATRQMVKELRREWLAHREIARQMRIVARRAERRRRREHHRP